MIPDNWSTEYYWIKPLLYSIVIASIYLVAVCYFLFLEFQSCKRKGLGKACVLLHLISLPLAFIGYHAAMMPIMDLSAAGTRSFGLGMIIMLTVPPVVYFGGHIAATVFFKPAPRISVTMGIALTSLLVFGSGIIVAGNIKGIFYKSKKYADRTLLEYAKPVSPGPYHQAGAGRFRLPDGEILIWVKFSTDGSLELVDFKMHYRDLIIPQSGMTTYRCLCGPDLHMFFILEKDGILPYFRLKWKTVEKPDIYVSEITPELPQNPPLEFTIKMENRFLLLPVPLPKSAIWLKRSQQDRHPTSNTETCQGGTCLSTRMLVNKETDVAVLRLERPGRELVNPQTYEFKLGQGQPEN